MALKVLEQVEDQVFLLLGLALHEGVPEPRRQDKLLLLAVENFPIDEGVADGFGTEKRKEKRKSQWMSLRWPPGLSPRPSSRGSSATTVEEGEEKESLEGYLRTP